MQSTPFRVRHGIIVETSSNTSTAIVANNQVLTGSASNALVDLATAWNTTGNPTAIKLNVTNTASGANSALMDLQVSGISKFKVVPSGNVGIGTTTPAAKFHVQGTAGSYVMFKDTLSYSTTSAGGLELSDYYSTNKYGIYVDNAGILSIGYNNTGNALVKIDSIGNLSSGGARLGWANYSYSPGFTFASDASSGMFSPGVGSLGFSTAQIERLRIDGSGNVGIGITSPTAKFTVANSTNATSSHIYGTYTDASNYERINLTANSSGHYIIGEKAGTGSARPLYLGANNTTVVTVAANGNVGINTNTLSGKLNIDTGADSLAVRIGAISSTGSEINLGIGILNAGRSFIGTNTNTNPLDFGTRGNVPVIFYTNSTEKMRISGAGDVGIGTASPGSKLDVVGNISSSNTIFALFFDSVSDIAYKENVKPITNPIKILSQLNPVSFDWKTSKIKSYGLIAQEVEKILPSIVHEKPDGTKTVNYIEIIAFLIQAIKHQQQQIDNINNNRTA